MEHIRNIFIIIKKELRNYADSLMAYIVIVVLLVLSGYFFAAPLFVMQEATISHFINFMPLVFLFSIPAITMRLFSDEIKTGTMEILSTQPLNDFEIILGKYLASMVFLCVILVCTFIYPVSLLFLGSIDIGKTIASYLGLIMLGSMYTAVGIFASSITKNQIVSFVVSFIVCFIFFILGKLTSMMPSSVANIMNYIGVDVHYSNIARGVIDSRDMIYYLSVIVFFLYSSLSVIKSKK